MPKLTPQRVRVGLKGLRVTPETLLAYAKGWIAERDTPAGVALVNPYPYENEKAEAWAAGSRDYALALAEEKGPVNRYATGRRNLLTTADHDYDYE